LSGFGQQRRFRGIAEIYHAEAGAATARAPRQRLDPVGHHSRRHVFRHDVDTSRSPALLIMIMKDRPG